MSETNQKPKKEFKLLPLEEREKLYAKGRAKLKEIANSERRFDLSKVSDERKEEVLNKCYESRAKLLYASNVALAVKPMYEGILNARMNAKECLDIFVASFYAWFELTKNHKIYMKDIGLMWNKPVQRDLFFKYRFKFIPSRKFRSFAEKENLFYKFKPRVTKLTKKVVDRKGEVVVDFVDVLKTYLEKEKLEEENNERNKNYNKYTTTKDQ